MERRAKPPARHDSSLEVMRAFRAFLPAFKAWHRSRRTPGNLTHSRVLLLVCLHRSGAQTMGDLAALLGLPRPNITVLVDDLEREGLVTRCDDAHDKRIKWVELKGEGRRLGGRAIGEYESSVASLFDELPAADRHHLIATLVRLTGTLRELGITATILDERERALPRRAASGTRVRR